MKIKIFTHKILPIIALFMFVLFTLTTSCFAIEINYQDNIYTTASYFDNFRYYYIYENTRGGPYYCIVLSNSPIVLDLVNGTYASLDGSDISILYNSPDDLQTTLNEKFAYYTTTNSGSWYSQFDNFLISNIDVTDTDGNLVFQLAPQEEVQEIQLVELMKPTQVEEIPAQIVGIVKIVLPIFLTIFGILLVLYLIKSKNLLQL